MASCAIVATTLLAALAPQQRAEFSAGPATTTYLNLTPVADAFSSARTPHYRTGSLTYLTASARRGEAQVIYLRFAIPASARGQIQAAELQLTRTSHHLAGSLSARSVASTAWSEATLSAANAPRVGAVVATSSVNRATTVARLQVSRLMGDAASVTVAVTSNLTNGFAQFASRQARSHQPILHLTLGAPGLTTSNGSTSSAPPSSSASSHPLSSASSSSGSTSASGSQSSAPSSSAGGGTSGLSRPQCAISKLLVPACGVWWGVAPLAYMNVPLEQGVSVEENKAQRPLDIVHTYHVNDQLFPTATERSLALQPGTNRLLLINWKPATDMTWAAVAAGGADARIDRLAGYIKSSFPYPFFLAIWHEPENDVNPSAGSGMTAADYAAMYRHVALRLRADGVTNAITVMVYMGFDNWALQPWFSQLWPGNDVVDWVGLDPYGSGAASGYLARDFKTLVNRPDGSFPGYYSWVTSQFPGKPIMLAEWGVTLAPSNPDGQASFLNSVAAQIGDFPQIKALVYFDMPQPKQAMWKTDPASTAAGLAAYRSLARSPAIVAPPYSY